MSETVISIKDLSKSFGDHEVLRKIDIDVHSGEVICIVGSSGSGKSTMLNVLGLLDNNYSGEYMLDGIEASKLSNNELAMARNEKIGFVFQNFNLIKELSAKENVKMSLIFSNIYKKGKEKISKKVMDKSSSDILEKVGLKNHENKKPGQLSGGQQQRVSIVRALAMEPDILFFDEPTSALDPELVGEVLNTIKSLAEEGTTMILVTHEIGFAREVASRILFMDGGRIATDGRPEEIIDHPENQRLQQFLNFVNRK